MKLRENIISDYALRNFESQSSSLINNTKHISRGSRIISAGDDAAGLAVADLIKTQVNGNDKALANAQDGLSLLSIADGGMSSISEMIQKMRQLAIESSNDTYIDSDRNALNKEIVALKSEIDREAQTTTFNGKILLNGSNNIFNFHVGANSNEIVSIDLPDVTSAGLHLTGIDISTRDTAEESISILDDSLNRLSGAQAKVGATENLLMGVINFLGIQKENQASSESQIRDLNFAEASTESARRQILIQSSASALAQANINPQSILKLL